MEIKGAITQAKEMMESRKKQLQIQKEKWAKIKHQQVNKEVLFRESKKELLYRLQEKANELLKDKENVEGVKFIEEKGGFFTLDKGFKYAIYFYSDGSFKEQWWGMYMRDKNIQKVDIYCYDIETIWRILTLDFKELLIKQILEIGKNQKVKPEDSFKEMFGE